MLLRCSLRQQAFQDTSSQKPVRVSPSVAFSSVTVDDSKARLRSVELAGRVIGIAASVAVLACPLQAGAVAGGAGGGVSTPLSFQDLSGQDLSRKKYVKAELRATNFSNSKLVGASFFGALAKDANFSGANLSFADLESAELEGADFTNAILEGAQVTNAQFKKVKITGSDWTDVVLRRDIQRELCAIADGVNPVTGVSTKESLLCP